MNGYSENTSRGKVWYCMIIISTSTTHTVTTTG